MNASQFGLLFPRAVDDQICAQPLYVPGVAGHPRPGPRDVVYVADERLGLRASTPATPQAGEPLWHVNFNDPANGVTPVDHLDVGQACGVCRDISGNISILSTPVIDDATGTIYVVAKTERAAASRSIGSARSTSPRARERPNSPVVLGPACRAPATASMDGASACPSAAIENQRPALTSRTA